MSYGNYVNNGPIGPIEFDCSRSAIGTDDPTCNHQEFCRQFQETRRHNPA